MCDPTSLMIGSMLVSAAGAGINSYESGQNQRRQIEARNAAAEAEAIRQRGFQDESQRTFQSSVAEQGPSAEAQRRGQGQESRREFMAAGSSAPQMTTGAPIAASAPPIVGSEIARKVAQAVGSANRGNVALANLTGYDDAMLGGRFAMARSNSQLADTGSKAAGSASLLPLELRAAENNAYRDPSGLGDLLGIVGKAGTFAGASGWSPFGGGAAGAPAGASPTWGPYGRGGMRPY